MEILTTAIVEGKTLTVGDTWNIGNNINIVLHELFDIDGEVYMTTTTENQPMATFRLNEEGTETVTPNRYINCARIWVRKNYNLFS